MKHIEDIIRKTTKQFDPGEGAGGGTGGAGAAAGPGEGAQAAAAPAQQRRRSGGEDLSGVVYGIQTQDEQQTTAPEAMSQPDDGAQAEQETTQRTSFKDLIKSDEYKAEADEYIGNIVKDRLKGAKAQEALLGKAQATMERIAMRYNMDASDLNSFDFDKLNAKIDGDEIYLNERAALNGVSVDVQKQLDEAQRIKQSFERQQRELEVRQSLSALQTQAEQFKAVVPGFDLVAEMQSNPVFLQMVRPPQMGGSGLSVEQAYFATHHREMMGAGMQAAAQQARQSAANTIRAGQMRPAENGATTTKTAEVRSDPSKLKKSDFDEIFRQVEAGNKNISFG